MKSHDINLPDCLDAAVAAAKLGAAQLEEWRKKFRVTEKARADLVTDADHASQKAVKQYLLDRFPAHHFLGEEDHFGKPIEEMRPEPDSPPVWIVDPLDGTVNYVHDVPAYCVSIGLYVGGELVVGVILDPRMGELFTAAKGHGAHLNGEPIRVSDADQLGNSLLSTGFPADWDAQVRNLDAWQRISEHCRALRRTGSTAINLAYVAAGRFDGYWAYDNWSWDMAAGVVLIREAGGHVTTIDGHTFDPFRMDLTASNGKVHQALVDVLKG